MPVRTDLPAEPMDTTELFAEFANTLSFNRGQPREGLPDVDALLAWLREHGLVSERGRATEVARLRRDPREAAARMGRFRELRALLHQLAGELADEGQPTTESVTELNRVLREGLHYHQLKRQPDGAHYAVTQVGDRLDQARAAIASSFAHFVADDAPERLRVCANQGCRWIFVDRSPTGRRRWCDMRTCGNQAKAARHRARARSKQLAVPQPGVPQPAAHD
ncbi:MAG TPA: CGNR zinc finger domain-containing protein [Candidatus Limnocylindria bacterium]|jgi:predicted RNA-binding Zn ribbon-like protein